MLEYITVNKKKMKAIYKYCLRNYDDMFVYYIMGIKPISIHQSAIDITINVTKGKYTNE